MTRRDIGVLGPSSPRADGRPLPVRSSKALALLVVLALDGATTREALDTLDKLLGDA